MPVTVLGHIFEQSITDIEKKRAEARGEAPPSVTKRKREGVVYTPDMVTRFLVDETLGRTLAERRAALEAEHGFGDGAMAPEKELAFWRAWLEILRESHDRRSGLRFGRLPRRGLRSRWRRNIGRCWRGSRNSARRRGIDAFDEIVTKNLFGVDLNSRVGRNHAAVAVAEDGAARPSAAKSGGDDPRRRQPDRGRRLYRRPFDWRAAFPSD